MNKVFPLALSLVLAYGTAFIGSLFTVGAIERWYMTLAKPTLNPPNWVFGPVWTVLYTLMAIAAYRVYQKRSLPRARIALVLYVFHLVVNALWSIVFFGMQNPLEGLIVIVFLLMSIVVLTFWFYRIDHIAGLLFLPYVAWVLFATYLNASIVLLN